MLSLAVTKHPFSLTEKDKYMGDEQGVCGSALMVGIDAHGQVTQFPPSKKALTSYFWKSELFDALMYDRTICCESVDEACKYSLKMGSQLNSSH